MKRTEVRSKLLQGQQESMIEMEDLSQPRNPYTDYPSLHNAEYCSLEDLPNRGMIRSVNKEGQAEYIYPT